jgi:hypothetical protein
MAGFLALKSLAPAGLKSSPRGRTISPDETFEGWEPLEGPAQNLARSRSRDLRHELQRAHPLLRRHALLNIEHQSFGGDALARLKTTAALGISPASASACFFAGLNRDDLQEATHQWSQILCDRTTHE